MREADVSRCAEMIEKNREKFRAFYGMISEYNKKFNLTAILKEEEAESKHFFDSLAGEFLFPAGASVAEVGSGAGFPSIPLMIARGDLRFTLIESTRKKCEFLRAAVKELGLNATVECARAEDLGRDARFRETFDVCCARAVARLSTLAEYCLPLVKRGGTFLSYKGKNGQEEEEEARGAIRKLGGGEIRLYAYELPQGAGERVLVQVEKAETTPRKYPRGQGRERRNPLV